MITNNSSSAFHVPPVVLPEIVEPSEVDQLADALAARFEELSLIHTLSASLSLGNEAEEVINLLLSELGPCIDASTLAVLLDPDEETGFDGFTRFVGESIDSDILRQTAVNARSLAVKQVGNQGTVSIVNDVRAADGTRLRVVVVNIERRERRLGRMVALRPFDAEEFGTIEADLMKSTSMMLAVHLINQRQYIELQQMFEGTIQSLVSALDAKDTYTCGHSNRVSEMAVELSTRLGYDEESVARIRMGGILHDIGKIGVDDSVLGKPGRLTDEEFEQIKQHPVLGYDILKGIRQFRHILPIVRHHHESWDGRGYPDGLAGNDIPRDAQIMAVADAFDAMTSDRPYRSGMTLEKVIAIFEKGSGQQWAADVVDTLLGMPEVMERYARREAEVAAAESAKS